VPPLPAIHPAVSLTTYTSIPFQKLLSLPACAGLADIRVSAFLLNASTATLLVSETRATIHNPSVFAVSNLGALTFDAEFEGSYMTTLVSDPVSLVPGANEVRLVGVLAPADMAAAHRLVSLYLSERDVALVAIARDSPTQFALLNAGMRGLRLPVTLVGTKLNLIQSIEFQALGMNPLNETAIELDGPAIVTVLNPLGPSAPLPINFAQLTVDAYFVGKRVGRIVTPALAMQLIPQSTPSSLLRFGVQITSILDLTIQAAVNPDNTGSAASTPALPWDIFVQSFIQSTGTLRLELNGFASFDAVLPTIGPQVVVGMPVDNQVVLAGMQGLSQLSIQSVSVPSNSPIAGLSVAATVALFNPSIASVYLGTVELSLEYDSIDPTSGAITTIYLGQSTVTDMNLAVGANQLTALGYLFPSLSPPPSSPPSSTSSTPLSLQPSFKARLATALDLASPFFVAYLSGRTQQIRVRGLRVLNARASWLQTAVQSIAVNVDFAGVAAPVVQSLSLQQMRLTFDGQRPLVATVVRAQLNMPFACPYSVDLVSNLAILLNVGGVGIGALSASGADLTTAFDTTAQTVTITSALLPLSVSASAAFADFVRQTVRSSAPVGALVSGAADTVVTTAMGTSTMRGLPTNGNVTVAAFDSFAGRLMVRQIDVVDGRPNALRMSVLIAVDNPTNLLVALGSLSLEMRTGDNEVRLGTSTIGNFELTAATLPANASSSSGPPQLAITELLFSCAFFTSPTSQPSSPDVMFLANFINGVSQPLLLVGSQQSTPVQLLQPAMDGFQAVTTVPGLPRSVVTEFHVKVTTGEVFGDVFPTQGVIVNPFTVDWAILATDCRVMTKAGVEIGYWKGDYRSQPIFVPASGTVTTDFLNVTITRKFDPSFIATIVDTLLRDATMSVVGPLTVRIGAAFETTILWQALQVHTTLVL
jgi:hypothetical protein